MYWTALSGRHVGYHRPPQVEQIEVEMNEISAVLISLPKRGTRGCVYSVEGSAGERRGID